MPLTNSSYVGSFFKLTNQAEIGFECKTIEAVYDPSKTNLKKAIEEVCRQAQAAVDAGTKILVVSNRNISDNQVAIPSLLYTGAVQQFLVKNNTVLFNWTADAIASSGGSSLMMDAYCKVTAENNVFGFGDLGGVNNIKKCKV